MAQTSTGYSWQLTDMDGDDRLNILSTGAQTGGVPFVAGNVLQIPCGDISGSGVLSAVQMQGLWQMPKATPLVIAAYAPVYWDDSAKKITTTTTDHLCGIARGPWVDRAAGGAASGDTWLHVWLMPELALAMAAAVVVDTTALNTHINLGTGAHAGTAISFTPHGTITSTNSAAAINEIDGDVTATRGSYLVEFTGGNSTSAPVAVAITAGRTGVTPAAGDEVKWVRGFVTLTGVPVAMPVVGTAFGADLVTSSGVKINQLQAAGDLSLNTYYAEIIPVRPTP